MSISFQLKKSIKAVNLNLIYQNGQYVSMFTLWLFQFKLQFDNGVFSMQYNTSLNIRKIDQTINQSHRFHYLNAFIKMQSLITALSIISLIFQAFVVSSVKSFSS